MALKKHVRDGLFRDTSGKEALLGGRCSSCNQIFFPLTHKCLNCGHEHLEKIELSRRGTLYSYTTGYMPALHFMPPYTVGYITLNEGVRIFAPLKVEEGMPLDIGMEMELIIEKLWEEGDTEVIGYKFKPV